MAKKKKTVRREWTRDDIKDLKAHSKGKRDFLRTMTPALLTDGLRIEGGI
ncbi:MULTISPECIES: hypothetical protein [unclassified Bradyrhizobium]|nr:MULTISPECIES: hypothetical protein [unclassified Bradyrhizobium]MCK1588564.1 hypothetical protein [Bradyrhizobium sp. 169]UPJ31912.1 hypothetical protein IVB54_39230 [Bradyrhizobium sp. CW1]